MLLARERRIFVQLTIWVVVYRFSCECSHSYVERTTFRLRERIKQHIPADAVNSVVPGDAVEKRGRGRPSKLQGGAVKSVLLPSELDSVSSRTRSKVTSVSSVVFAQTDPATQLTQCSKTDTAITSHLRQSVSCREAACRNVMSHFTILGKARHVEHLQTLEAVFIASHNPKLCVQKERLMN